jgi:4-hydroxythreonine-4-phosphate dehydrogenase
MQQRALLHLMPPFVPWQPGTDLPTAGIAVYEVSRLDCGRLGWGQADSITGKASATYLEEAVRLIGRGMADAVTTCPISKYSWHQAGYDFPGHTEMLAALTDSRDYAMMLAGSRLRVVPATIHLPLRQVPEALTSASLLALLATIDRALRDDFAISTPRIGVAGLNPHSGEGGLFGEEETTIIAPAIAQARQLGLMVEGPLPPDTIFHQAAHGAFDTVLAMYHDQGLIPFKLLHFADGVNVTLGLPIVRTSVDHGTAYDIAGKGVASDDSLAAAVELADLICRNRGAARTR